MEKRKWRIESDRPTEMLRPSETERAEEEAEYAGQRLWIRGNIKRC